MEETIKILEEFINDRLFKYARNAFTESDIKDLDMLIENLIKGYRELEKSKITYERVTEMQEENKRIVDKNYIPKAKIKEFVKENKWDLLETEYHFDSTVVDADELLKFMEDK